ncbi:MAG: VWA domain-containing protein [Bifidobacteriaceae bacterium]|jgi:Mg-chelatase subunit ChlD|nr:VWA domain-containing protein [Bifidobacteriaceae bacterium]
MNDREQGRRWRLILGRYADRSLAGSGGRGGALEAADLDLDQVLGFLYDRQYTERGHLLNRPDGIGQGRDQGGGSGPSALTAITWLERTRKLFPQETFERLQTEAVERYGMTDLLADPSTAASLVPSPQLGAALLALRGKLDADLKDGVRTVIARVVADIVARLKTAFTSALTGRRDRFRRSVVPRAQDFDWRGTIRANLKNYDPVDRRLIVDQTRFTARARRHLAWDVILCVDQSASMASSVLYSAVCASILAALPGIEVRLLLFDTSVVDMTAQAHDPVDVLMTAQLGGGTDIARAVAFAEALVKRPARTVLVLISDFEEGGSIPQLLAAVGRLRGAGVTLLGLAALDESAAPAYDRRVGTMLAERGMAIAALTPEHLAEWLAEVMG